MHAEDQVLIHRCCTSCMKTGTESLYQNNREHRSGLIESEQVCLGVTVSTVIVWCLSTVNRDRRFTRLNLSSCCLACSVFVPSCWPWFYHHLPCVSASHGRQCICLFLISLFALFPPLLASFSLRFMNSTHALCGRGFAIMDIDFSRCAASEAALCPDPAWASHAIRGSRCRAAQTKLWHKGTFL